MGAGFELIGRRQVIGRDDGLLRDAIGLGDAAQRLPALDGYRAGLRRPGPGPTQRSPLALADNARPAALHEHRRGSATNLPPRPATSPQPPTRPPPPPPHPPPVRVPPS